MPKTFKYYYGTKEGGKKASITTKQKRGDDFYKNIGRMGGKVHCIKGFASNIELARAAGRKGGAISKRGPAKWKIKKNITGKSFQN